MPNEQLTIEERKTAYIALRDSGLGVGKSASVIGYNASHASRSLEPLRRKGLVRLAICAVKKTLKGEPVGRAELPKTSDVLRASEIILDRVDPKVTRSESKSLNVNLDITPQQAQELDSIMSEFYTKKAEYAE